MLVPVLSALRGALRIRPLRRETCRSRPSQGDVDFGWFDQLSRAVNSDERRKLSLMMLDMLRPFLGVIHGDVLATVDAERGSLRLQFPCGTAWRFAVEDVEAASQIAAGSRLGGLRLRLSVAGEGMIRIYGTWDRLSYVLCGVPARVPG